MKKSILVFVILLLLLTVGCKAPMEEEELPVAPSIAFDTLLTIEQVKEATDVSVTQTQNFEDGSIGYFSEDSSESIYMSYTEMDLTAFDEMLQELALFGTLTDAPNLSEKAVWCEQTGNLLVYDDGRALDIRVQYATPHPNNSLLASRQLAALLLEKW